MEILFSVAMVFLLLCELAYFVSISLRSRDIAAAAIRSTAGNRLRP